MESILGSEPMRELQLSRLHGRIADIFAHSPFFAGRLRARGVSAPHDIKMLDDWSRAVQPFTKSDYRTLLDECGGDVYRFLSQILPFPLHDIVTMAATSGTTGSPQPYPLTREDLDDLWGEYLMRFRWRAGIRPGDRLLHAFALSMFFGGVPFLQCSQRTGVTQIPVGAESGVARVLTMAKFFGGNALMCTPSLAEHMIERAEEILGAPISSLGIKTLICGGEPGAGIPVLRQRIERAYGAKLYDFGAGMGVSCDWPEYQGMHWVADDLMLYELIDPLTYEPVEMRDGAQGEAVMTALVGGGMGFVRQSPGDLHEVTVSPCPCGATGFRYRIIGRVDDMLKVKGVIVYPAAIDSLISEFIPKVTGEFRIRLSEPPPRVVPPLRLRIERGKETTEDALAALEKEICRVMHERLRVTPAIEWLDPYHLPRSDHKTRFIEVVKGSAP